jgi:hypothetical protein
LEQETETQKLVADLTIDKVILQEGFVKNT